MLDLFRSILSFTSYLQSKYYIDTWVSRLHYRVTTPILLVATILGTCRQFFGENIVCMSDTKKKNFDKIIETLCLFTSSYTIEKYHKDVLYEYPGIGPLDDRNNNEEIRKYSYYAWVPFLLFGQAIMFSVPYLIWKSAEGKSIGGLVEALQFVAFSRLDKDITINGQLIASAKSKNIRMKIFHKALIQRIQMHGWWSVHFICFEILNIVNVIVQIIITNLFLNKKFYSLGYDYIEKGSSASKDIFPEVTACSVYYYGPSGGIQKISALCVMPLNTIHEKIYLLLWFWYVILLGVSCLSILWRIITILLYSSSVTFNQLIFTNNFVKNRDTLEGIVYVTKKYAYSDWLFLKYMCKNINSNLCEELFCKISESMKEEKCAVSNVILSRDYL